jgi:hypothetical protein
VSFFRNLFGGTSASSGSNGAGPAPPKLAVGQTWAVKTLADAAVTIGRLETLEYEKDGQSRSLDVVHMTIWGLKTLRMPDGNHSPGIAGHIPISPEAFLLSVSHCTGEGQSVDGSFEEGYEIWKDADGGVFTISIPEIIDIINNNLETHL